MLAPSQIIGGGGGLSPPPPPLLTPMVLSISIWGKNGKIPKTVREKHNDDFGN